MHSLTPRGNSRKPSRGESPQCIDGPQCIDDCDVEKLYSLVSHTGSLYTENDEDDAELHVRLLNLQLHEAHMSTGEVFASSVRLMQFLSHERITISIPESVSIDSVRQRAEHVRAIPFRGVQHGDQASSVPILVELFPAR